MKYPNHLKEICARNNTRQIEIAVNIGVQPSRLSAIAQGWVSPRPEEKSNIARILNVPEREIFPVSADEGKVG